MPINGGDPTTPHPPPMIGKIGPYTVFVTPPQTPKPSSSHSHHQQSPLSDSPVIQLPPAQSPPPVLPPPVHYNPKSDASSFAFFWNAVAKVQNAHSSLDGYVAHWFGLNQSKYQWALDDYYETKGVDHEDAKAKICLPKLKVCNMLLGCWAGFISRKDTWMNPLSVPYHGKIIK